MVGAHRQIIQTDIILLRVGKPPPAGRVRAAGRYCPGVVVEAAGGVVWRRSPAGHVEVLLVHRPRYDDWTLPKGKLDPGEAPAAAALREVEEETGWRARLGPPLPAVRYTDQQQREKRVRYWAMEGAGGAFRPNDEVDAIRWLDLAAAAALLTYAHDRLVLEALEGALGTGQG